MVCNYVDDSAKPQNCQNWEVGTCIGMNTCQCSTLSIPTIKHLPIAANAVEGLVTTAVPKCPSQAPGDTNATQAKSLQMLVAGWILLEFLASDFCTLHDYEIAFWTQGVSPRLPWYQCSSCYELALVAVFGKTASATPPDIYLTSFYMGVLLGLPLC